MAIDPSAIAAALRVYFPTPAGLSRLEAVAWEQGVAGLVGTLAPALARENIGPADLHAAIAVLSAQPHALDSAFTVPGYIASGAGYVVGQACYWLGLPGSVSIGAGLLVPNLALSSWRTLNELALQHAAAGDGASQKRLPAFLAQHFERQNHGFMQQAREAFLRNVRHGRQVRNLAPRDGLMVLLKRSLPTDLRPAITRPAYAGEQAHLPTVVFLAQAPERIAGMVRRGSFTDVRELAVPAGWTNLHTLRTLADPDFYRQQVVPHGPANLAGQMLALTVNTAQRGAHVLLEPLSRWLHQPVRPAESADIVQV